MTARGLLYFVGCGPVVRREREKEFKVQMVQLSIAVLVGDGFLPVSSLSEVNGDINKCD